MAHRSYLDSRGEKLITVTQATGLLTETKRLNGWAYKLGRTHERDKVDTNLWRHISDLGKAGTLAHSMIHTLAKGGDPEAAITEKHHEKPVVVKGALKAYSNFKEWVKMINPDVIASEVALKDETIGVGGTIDLIGMIKDQICVIDWKTSKGIYENHLAQVAAYAHLVECGKPADEDYPEEWEDWLGCRVECIHIVTFDRDSGKCAHKFYDRKLWRGEPFHAFLAALQLRTRLNALKGVL
jgi:hypothetical protein